jgi:hypothetical protein
MAMASDESSGRSRSSGRFPGYDVLAKWDTPSWNAQTRRVVAERLALRDEGRFFTSDEWMALSAVYACITPQPSDRPAIPVAALVDSKMHANETDGYRNAQLPPMREAWKTGLKALDADAQAVQGERFHRLPLPQQVALLRQAEDGTLRHSAWGNMPPALFFKDRLLRDIVHAYYSHPAAWSEIGFGGPASPRGYVHMDFNRRDPWEAAEAGLGDEERVRRLNRRVG